MDHLNYKHLQGEVGSGLETQTGKPVQTKGQEPWQEAAMVGVQLILLPPRTSLALRVLITSLSKNSFLPNTAFFFFIIRDLMNNKFNTISGYGLLPVHQRVTWVYKCVTRHG